jgi:hypothetical protein
MADQRRLGFRLVTDSGDVPPSTGVQVLIDANRLIAESLERGLERIPEDDPCRGRIAQLAAAHRSMAAMIERL